MAFTVFNVFSENVDMTGPTFVFQFAEADKKKKRNRKIVETPKNRPKQKPKAVSNMETDTTPKFDVSQLQFKS
jgi:ABC-type Na+ efflux pump permease subunit